VTVTVREAKEPDLPALLDLLDELRANSARPDRPPEKLSAAHIETLRRLGDSDHFAVLVAEEAGAVLGTCTLAIVPNLSHGGRPWCVLENMAVHERARRRGVGKLLVTEAVSRARHASCYKLSLTSNLQRQEAHHFYEMMGFDFSHKGFTQYFD
jgi:GNAT superfamily N-acetyltransferase